MPPKKSPVRQCPPHTCPPWHACSALQLALLRVAGIIAGGML
jgi:hypothetical protein